MADAINEAEARLQQQLAALPQRSQELSEAKQEWLAKRWDLPQGPQASQLAANAHAYVTGLGIAEDSPEYFSAMAVYLEPPGYESPPTPNDVADMCGISAQEYNREARRLHRLKQSGEYGDR